MTLLRGGRETHLSRKAFELLRILIANRHRVVKKAELQAELWPDTFVVDSNVNVLVVEVRKALDDTARDPRLVRTIHGVGYRFSAEVEPIDSDAAASGARCWLMVEDRRCPLPTGEATLGRDPACDVWLDAPGVSRRHARIRTEPNGDATLEDNNSMNGTYVGRARISGPTRLRDGDEIHLGSLALTFRMASPMKVTERVRPPDPAP
jgi:hypothetical protein